MYLLTHFSLFFKMHFGLLFFFFKSCHRKWNHPRLIYSWTIPLLLFWKPRPFLCGFPSSWFAGQVAVEASTSTVPLIMNFDTPVFIGLLGLLLLNDLFYKQAWNMRNYSVQKKALRVTPRRISRGKELNGSCVNSQMDLDWWQSFLLLWTEWPKNQKLQQEQWVMWHYAEPFENAKQNMDYHH